MRLQCQCWFHFDLPESLKKPNKWKRSTTYRKMFIGTAMIIVYVQMPQIFSHLGKPDTERRVRKNIKVPRIKTKTYMIGRKKLEKTTQNIRLFFINIFQRDHCPCVPGQCN